ncbi:nucleotidyl transferase AbiEii/AbiGii toxin family protein, partial [Thermodesulfobacteriota bacterium]
VRTEFPDKIIAFSQEFITTKQIQWNAFRKKLKQDHIPTNFDDIVTQVRKFIDPIASALISQKPPPSKWFAPGPWM